MISEQAEKIHHRALVWDTHACFRLDPHADLSELERYRDSGVDFVSLNIGMDLNSLLSPEPDVTADCAEALRNPVLAEAQYSFPLPITP